MVAKIACNLIAKANIGDPATHGYFTALNMFSLYFDDLVAK
jgi:hypothetical protein